MIRKTAFFIPLLILVGCTSEEPPTPVVATKDPKAERIRYPDFTLSALDGKPWTLSEHRGRPVVVNYWATWCGPCRMETPAFVQLSKHFKGKVDFVGVSLDYGNKPVVQKFVKEQKIPYPTLLPEPNDPLASHVDPIPTTFILDKNGLIAQKIVGAANPNPLAMNLQLLIAE